MTRDELLRENARLRAELRDAQAAIKAAAAYLTPLAAENGVIDVKRAPFGRVIDHDARPAALPRAQEAADHA